MRYINTDEARRLLSVEDSFRLAEEALRIYGRERAVASRPAASILIAPGVRPTIIPIKGAQSEALGAAGVFFGAQFGDYYFALMDVPGGRLIGIIEQAWLTVRRTATVGVLAAQWLARPGARVAAVIGAGRIGAEVVRLLPRRLQLDEIRIATGRPASARAAVERLAPEVGCPLRAVDTADAALAGADIVITITLATEPVVGPGRLAPGATLIALGGVPEIDFGVLAEIDRLVVDEIDYALLRGSLAAWVERRDIDAASLRARIDADLGEIALCAKSGRTSPDERVFAAVQGMAIADLAVARYLVDRAEADNLGQTLEIRTQRITADGPEERALAAFVAEGLARKPRP